jgi:hypothetical protein
MRSLVAVVRLVFFKGRDSFLFDALFMAEQ